MVVLKFILCVLAVEALCVSAYVAGRFVTKLILDRKKES